MALPLSPPPGSALRSAGGTSRRAPARLSMLSWPAALAVVACCGLAGCGTPSAPGARATHTVTVQASSAPATPASGSTPTTAPAVARPGTCPASDLSGSLGTQGGAAGTFYTVIILTNTSAATCNLYGYPGVSFVTGPGGSEIGAPADRNTVSPVTEVTLAPGGQANMLLGVADVGVYPPSQCQPTAVSWLRIYPPGDYDSLYLQYSTQTCALTSQVAMHVTAMRPGLTGVGT